MANQILNIGIYLGLLAQLDKLARHNRQGSFRTKERYYEAMKRFCAFLADAFRLQKAVQRQREASDRLYPEAAGRWEGPQHHQNRPGRHPVFSRSDGRQI